MEERTACGRREHRILVEVAVPVDRVCMYISSRWPRQRSGTYWWGSTGKFTLGRNPLSPGTPGVPGYFAAIGGRCGHRSVVQPSSSGTLGFSRRMSGENLRPDRGHP
jgi:hypothetical protein